MGVKGKKQSTSQGIAYVVKDKNLGDIEIRNSANAWWLDRTKVDNLIQAFKIDATLEEAWFNAGISKRQWEYFIEVHPDFCGAKELSKKRPGLAAKRTLYNDLNTDGNGELALKYLAVKQSEEYGRKDKIDIGLSEELRKREEENKGWLDKLIGK